VTRCASKRRCWRIGSGVDLASNAPQQNFDHAVALTMFPE
jgi:hypothetical protein